MDFEILNNCLYLGACILEFVSCVMKYDLEERTLEFSKVVIGLCKKLPATIVNRNLTSQLVRSCGSVGANYIEANDSLGKKDFVLRLKISRKEAKETIYWLKLVKESNKEFESEVNEILSEAVELRNILSSIINKVST